MTEAPETPPSDGKSSRLIAVGATRTDRTQRLSGRPNSDGTDTRSEAQRDCDRIIYSNAWRRLGAVTQVITPFDDAPAMHNRLTHSEKVAKVARSIAERLLATDDNHALLAGLGGLDADVCEAAALAHDLGHPPFGHIGESTLDRLARKKVDDGGLGLVDGFEGNAQSMRIVTLGNIRSPKYEGLDLTLATLSGLAKYPWMRADKVETHDEKLATDAGYRRHWNKFNFYREQRDLLKRVRAIHPAALGEETQSLEASVMDVADDISYAVHDLEDFYLSGILNMSEIRDDLEAFLSALNGGTMERPSPFVDMTRRLPIDYAGFYSDEKLIDATERVLRHLNYFTRPSVGDPYTEQVARAQGAKMIGRYVGSITVSERPPWEAGPHIHLSQVEWHEVQVLKVITKHYVISRPDFALLQRGQQTVLESLVQLLRDWVDSDDDFKRLPAQLREEIRIARAQEAGDIEASFEGNTQSVPRGKPYRVILDYLCTLGDHQCLGLYHKLSGAAVHKIGLSTF